MPIRPAPIRSIGSLRKGRATSLCSVCGHNVPIQAGDEHLGPPSITGDIEQAQAEDAGIAQQQVGESGKRLAWPSARKQCSGWDAYLIR